MTAVSPGTIAVFQPNQHYRSHEEYMEASPMRCATSTKTSPRRHIVQLDCPDLAMGRHSRFKELGEGSSSATPRSRWTR